MFIMLSWYSEGIYASLVGIKQITLKSCINFNKNFKYLSPSVTEYVVKVIKFLSALQLLPTDISMQVWWISIVKEI